MKRYISSAVQDSSEIVMSPTITDSELLYLLDDYNQTFGDGMEHLLYAAKNRLTSAEFRKMKARLADLVSEYSARIHSDEYDIIETMRNLVDAIKSLDVVGLRATSKRNYVQVTYTLDTAKYDITSDEFLHNVKELSEYFESIPAVTRQECYSVSTGQVWNLFISLNLTDVEGSYSPDIIDISPNSQLSYKVTYVVAGTEHEAPNGIAYSLFNEKEELPDDSPTTFAHEFFPYDRRNPNRSRDFATWSEVFHYLDSVPYLANRLVIRNMCIQKIVRYSDGHGKTIYSRSLPNTNNIEPLYTLDEMYMNS